MSIIGDIMIVLRDRPSAMRVLLHDWVVEALLNGNEMYTSAQF